MGCNLGRPTNEPNSSEPATTSSGSEQARAEPKIQQSLLAGSNSIELKLKRARAQPKKAHYCLTLIDFRCSDVVVNKKVVKMHIIINDLTCSLT